MNRARFTSVLVVGLIMIPVIWFLQHRLVAAKTKSPLQVFPDISEVSLIQDEVVRLNVSLVNSTTSPISIVGANFPCDCMRLLDVPAELPQNTPTTFTIEINSGGVLSVTEEEPVPIDIYTSIGPVRDSFRIKFRLFNDARAQEAIPVPDPNA